MPSPRSPFAAFALCALVFANWMHDERPAPESPAVRTAEVDMSDIAQGFRRLEKALESSDQETAESESRSLGELAARIRLGAPARNQHAAGLYSAVLDSVTGHAREIEGLAAEGRLAGAAQAFEALRGACVTCHVTFRENNEQIGLYPALKNTVSGSVRLWDADGNERVDRSWVLVFLERRGREPEYEHLRSSPAMSQVGVQFAPRVLAVVRGTEVAFPNDDTVLHNVFSVSKVAPFDLGIYKQGSSRSVLMSRTGLVRVYCNLHPEMAASIVVLDNPYFAVTSESGLFTIHGIPDGEYTLRAWNDMEAVDHFSIELSGGQVVEASFELHETRRPAPHRNKFGMRYPKKY